MKIENWSITSQDTDPYLAPELRSLSIQGRREDGRFIVTSRVISCLGRNVTTRSGSNYELGTIDPKYVEAFPNAEERFFASFDADGNPKEVS